MRMEDYDRGSENNFQLVSIWAHLYNIPFSAITDNIVRMTQGKIGECIEVVSDSDGRCWGTFAKARIKWKISQPLKMRVRVRLGQEAEPFWVDVKYARLPDFYFICGLLAHSIKECSSEVMKNRDDRRDIGLAIGSGQLQTLFLISVRCLTNRMKGPPG